MGQTDARTDIYCLGATMYHLVTGQNPSAPPYELYPITKWNPGLSTGLEHIIIKCTQRNPDDRYQSVRELRHDLEHYTDLEVQAQRQYRCRLRRFVAAVGLSAICAFSGMGFALAAGKKQGDDYQELIQMAEISSVDVDACTLYLEAVAVDESRREAYHGFYSRAVEDGVFSDAEEELFLKLGLSEHRYLQEFQRKNEDAYADFCYEMGNAYWYYYEHEENRQSRAVSWFQTAMNLYEQNHSRETEYRRCRLYVEIGTFYKKVIASQIDGTDAGMYGAYWKSLTELKALNDDAPDRELITLRIYREIATRTVEYAKYFMEEGVKGDAVLSMLSEIEIDMQQMEQGAASAARQEIEEIRRIVSGARKMVRSTYKVQEAGQT